ncbi:MAG: CoA-binding protein [Candidatus Nanopelagicales bacterium]
MKIAEAAAEFLNQKRIAVTGVSSHPEGHGSNTVYKRLRERVHRFRGQSQCRVRGGRSDLPDLASIPGGVDAVVIATAADRAPATMREIAELGIKYAWMHRSFGAGSVSEDATRIGYGRPG